MTVNKTFFMNLPPKILLVAVARYTLIISVGFLVDKNHNF